MSVDPTVHTHHSFKFHDPLAKGNYNHLFIYLFIYLIFFFLKRFYLFFRERGREGEGEGEKHHCVVASHAPYWGPGP